jgi:hypothetical protein
MIPDPNATTPTMIPAIFNDSMDETATYNSSTFLTGLNLALSECIKQGDLCYAVVIKDPTDLTVPRSSFGLAYQFQLAQKPPSNSKNDSEYLLCNTLYSTYLKNKTSTGISNLMQNSIECDIQSYDAIQYNGGSGNFNNNSKNTPSTPIDLSYMKMGLNVKKAPFPWIMVLIISGVVLFCVGVGYWYFNFGPGAPEEPVKKVVNNIVNTSKLIKKSGGYFFFV